MVLVVVVVVGGRRSLGGTPLLHCRAHDGGCRSGEVERFSSPPPAALGPAGGREGRNAGGGGGGLEPTGIRGKPFHHDREEFAAEKEREEEEETGGVCRARELSSSFSSLGTAGAWEGSGG